MKWRDRLDKLHYKKIIIAASTCDTLDLNQLCQSSADVQKAAVHIIVESGAQLHIVVAGQSSMYCWDLIVTLKDQALCVQIISALPQTSITFNAQYHLEGVGASLKIVGLTEAHCNDVQTIVTKQIHDAASTCSSVQLVSIVDVKGACHYDGLIRIEHGAIFTKATQNHAVLLLDKASHVISRPSLEIDDNRVACFHATSISYLDPLMMWALESRGIPPRKVRALLIKGFRDRVCLSLN